MESALHILMGFTFSILRSNIYRIRSIIQAYRFPVILALSIRVGISLWMALVWVIVEPYFPSTPVAYLSTYGNLTPLSNLIGRSLFDVWLRWDAVHYMNIARIGYEGVGIGDTNFLPLYPYVVLILKNIFPMPEVISGLIVSTIACIIAFIAFYKLVLLLFCNEQLARWTIIIWGIYPTSLFLFAPYTDSLYAALTILCLLFLESQNWLLTGMFAMFAGITRTQGALLVFPIATKILCIIKSMNFRHAIQPMIALILAPFGFILYNIWRYQRGISTLIESYDSYSKIVFIDPLRGLLSAVVFAINTRDWLSITEALSLVLFLAISVWLFFSHEFRRKYSLLAYNSVTLLLFLSKHNLLTTPIQSANRYVLSLYPAFIGLAFFLLQRSERTRRIYMLSSLCGMIIASTLYVLWFFVG